MNTRYNDYWSRREFLSAAALAGAGSLLRLPSDTLAAEPPPETTRVRINRTTSICSAPKYVAEELLREEGFTDVQYVTTPGGLGGAKALATGETNLTLTFSGPLILRLDAGDPILILAGVHPGCFELFGTDRVRSIRDLKGKTVAVDEMGASRHIFLSIMAAYVGLNPNKDITWVTHPRTESMRLLAEGKVDAYMAFPPDPIELRAKKIGHVVVNSMMDRPWSQYFCCMVAANREFVRKHPAATRRALRALLKATNICALEPDRAAQRLVDRGLTKNYDYALQTMKEVPYDKWHEYDPEDTLRFYGLRLQEIGTIKSIPQKIIAQGTDWRFLRELKNEMKG